MTTQHDELEGAWHTLELGHGTDEFSLATVRLDLDVGYGPVRVALGVDGEPQLLIPTEAGRRPVENCSSAAVAVRHAQFVASGRLQTFLVVRCLVPELIAPFRGLVDEVIRRLRAGAAPELALTGAIEQFRELLRTPVGPSADQIIGLFGELLVLNELLAQDPGAVVSWTGPLGQPWDFSSGRVCAEVKTTLRRVGRVIHVSGIDQLVPPSDGRPLLLVYQVLSRPGSAGSSLRDQIAVAVERSVDTAALEERLRALGLQDWRARPAIAEDRYELHRREFYRVDENFPRLDARSLREGHPLPGVRAIEYELDLDHARAWEVEAAEAWRNFHGGL